MGNILNGEGLATSNAELQLYDYDPTTGEFNGEFLYKIPQWTGIPAHSTMTAPPESKEGFAACYSEKDQRWYLLEDHRGQKAWRVDNRAQITVTSLGPVTYPHTLLAPATDFDEWVDGAWVTNTAAYEAFMAEKTNEEILVRLRKAETIINPLKDVKEYGEITPEQYAVLKAWIAYRLSVMAVNKKNPQWPDEPSFNPDDYKTE